MVLTIVGDNLEGNRGQEEAQERRQNHCRRRKSRTEASTNCFEHLPCNNQPSSYINRASVRWVSCRNKQKDKRTIPSWSNRRTFPLSGF
jgi:hypothetical protein